MTDTETIVNAVVNVLPLLVFGAVWWWLYRRYNPKNGMSLLDVQRAYLDEMKKTNLILERIAAALEKKNA
jgi:hypothetical protein